MERKWWTLVAVVLGTFMLLLDVTIVNVALPDIAKELHASLADLQWVVDAYALTLAALLLTSGSLADRFGRRFMFAIGIVVFTLGSLICGLAQSPTLLSVSRAGQGVGGAIMFSTALALIGSAFSGRDRGTAFGIFGATTGVAVAVGPVLGGALVSGLSWRWIFFVNIPVGIIALAVTLREVEESRDPHARRIDYVGLVTFSTGLAALVYGLIRSNEDGWSSGTVVGSLLAAAVLLVGFVFAEAYGSAPMFDLRLLRKPTFVGGLIAAFGISGSLFALFPFIVLYLQTGLGLTAMQTGLRFLVLSGPIFITAGIVGRLIDKVPTNLLIGSGFALVGISELLMRGISPDMSWTHLIPGFLVAGVGAGLINVPLASTAVGVVEPARAGMASGINATLRQVGIATGVAALGAIFSSHITDAVIARQPPLDGLVDGLNSVFLVGAILALCASVSSFVLIRQKDFVLHTHAPQPAPAAQQT